MTKLSSYFLVGVLFVGAVSALMPEVVGPIDDCCCGVEDVAPINEKFVHPVLRSLVVGNRAKRGISFFALCSPYHFFSGANLL